MLLRPLARPPSLSVLAWVKIHLCGTSPVAVLLLLHLPEAAVAKFPLTRPVPVPTDTSALEPNAALNMAGAEPPLNTAQTPRLLSTEVVQAAALPLPHRPLEVAAATFLLMRPAEAPTDTSAQELNAARNTAGAEPLLNTATTPKVPSTAAAPVVAQLLHHLLAAQEVAQLTDPAEEAVVSLAVASAVLNMATVVLVENTVVLAVKALSVLAHRREVPKKLESWISRMSSVVLLLRRTSRCRPV